MASWLPLTARQAEAGPLGTVLILGVTGISGYLAARNARLLGATRVVGAGRNPAGLERARRGGRADHHPDRRPRPRSRPRSS
jgi:threonine dehydrogenase-like Zn-dependent dehydrogenase